METAHRRDVGTTRDTVECNAEVHAVLPTAAPSIDERYGCTITFIIPGCASEVCFRNESKLCFLRYKTHDTHSRSSIMSHDVYRGGVNKCSERRARTACALGMRKLSRRAHKLVSCYRTQCGSEEVS